MINSNMTNLDSYSRNIESGVETNDIKSYDFAGNNVDSKQTIGWIDDCDFGPVMVYYRPKQKAIIADELFILNVPTDYKDEDIISAWELFKNHYGEYGTFILAYEQIADGECLFDRY